MNDKFKDESWLELLNKITCLAQTGLYYTKDIYDKERYEQLIIYIQELLKLKNHNTTDFQKRVMEDIGYATPKLDVRAVVFQDNKILLTREVEDGLWSLPGGWADVGYSASENVIKEVVEETGIHVQVKHLLALTDRRKHPHPPMFLHVYKAFFLCEVIGGELSSSIETTEAKYFGINELPEISEARVTREQIENFFKYINTIPERTYFD
ncbi:NUDIX hydrolase [Acinetobacter nosocomialis]|uniref:NUDIX hydrolase n=1 Tax=Acinetobacter nosocomialis TaxID=106654 RepID=UPI001F429BC7|nr:NUDIX hydrolase N-terminal domain-containing protein [Acinetobacter nosocomialis]MCE7531664.1 NUDIX hydrolase [Acinetobacter nosocomialis]